MRALVHDYRKGVRSVSAKHATAGDLRLALVSSDMRALVHDYLHYLAYLLLIFTDISK
jgi:hypothetical protein